MIFSGNTTALGASTIPMAEGYDCSFGASLALVEAARNDLAVFRAMVQADYKEMAICKESTGVVQEGELSTLHEAVGGGIFKKIAELFKKLVAKVKSIFHTFMSKINALWMKDKDLVKKYQNELARKSNIGKLEVKWRKVKNANHKAVDFGVVETSSFDTTDAHANYESESSERLKHYISKCGIDTDNVADMVKELVDATLEDEETLKLDEVGGWRKIASFLTEYGKKLKTMQNNINKSTTNLEKLVSFYDKKASALVNASMKDGDHKIDYKLKIDSEKEAEHNANQTSIDTANHQYEMAQAYQSVMLGCMQACQQIATIEYKQNKAAFMKAVAADNKKLEESATYLDAVAEAAENEVEDVISKALSDEELSDLTVASKNVKDGDVCDDPDKLTYGTNRTSNACCDTADGSIDSNYLDGGKVEESYFGGMFY